MTRIKPLKAKADILFSKWVRREGKCEKCGRTNCRLEAAHIFSRRYISTRYEPLNCLSLCSADHRWAHNEPVEFVEWIREYLGSDVYDELRRIAKTRIVKSNDAYYQDIIAKLKKNEAPYEV